MFYSVSKNITRKCNSEASPKNCSVSPVEEEEKEYPQPRVVIIGAGMAGLSAAARLAQSGLNNIVILEALESCAGRHSLVINNVLVYVWREKRTILLMGVRKRNKTMLTTNHEIPDQTRRSRFSDGDVRRLDIFVLLKPR
ncbi:Polyamine oxidase [Eumeta japonica]|uniref:Polyamine oxidase n=1 Tax=Eumeta variegata TaxID=151549 RepID=A0A4C1ZS43_EUMVA|nr:Polyamine oxidase [Eumeta japonica]